MTDAGAATVIQLEGQFGSPAYQSSGLWDETNATIVEETLFGGPGSVQLQVTPAADPGLWFRIGLEGPGGRFPGSGTYPVQRYPFQQAGFAGGDIAGSLGCNQGHGTVEVHEIEYAADDKVARIAADLRYSCTNSNIFSLAKLRIDSTVSLELPHAHAVVVSEQVITAGATVTLDGSASFADNATISSFRWRQIEGERVQILDDTAAITSFNFPNDKGDFQQMLFELAVTDTLGRTDTARTKVIAGTTLTPTVIRIFERGNNFVWRREVPGLGIAPSSPYEIEGGPLRGLFIDTVGPLIRLLPPTTRELGIGGFTTAQRSGQIPLFPGFSWFGCNYGPSDGTQYETYFDILDLAFGSLGVVDRAGFDFHARCEAGNRNTYDGLVRIGSYAPEQLLHPRALAGNDHSLFAGEPGFLNGSSSRSPDHTLSSFRWTQIGGPAVDIADPDSAITRVIPPASIAGPGVASFRLDVSDAIGRQSSDVVEMEVVPTSAPRTSLYVESDDSTFIGRGETVYLRDGQDTSIQALPVLLGSGASARDQIALLDENSRGWNIRITGGADGLFQPGYRSPTFSADPNGVLPSLTLGNTGRGCSRATGDIHVIDVSRDAESKLISIAIDFKMMCDGETGAMRGSLRFNSTVPHQFTILPVDAGDDQTLTEGNTVELVDASDASVRTRWTQISGPHLYLSDATSKRATFVPPTIPAGETRRFVFRLTNQRDDGAWGEDFTVISVADNGRSTWDGVAFDKYVDKPQSYVVGGNEFGFRTTNQVGNLASIRFGVESITGVRIGTESVSSTVFPVTEAVFRGVAANLPIEYFSQNTIPADFQLIVKDVNGQWQLGTQSTGDGLFLENGLSRLHVTVNPTNPSGSSNDQDSLVQSLTLRFAVVRLDATPSPPGGGASPGGGSSGGGGGSGSGLIILLGSFLLLRLRRRGRGRGRQFAAEEVISVLGRSFGSDPLTHPRKQGWAKKPVISFEVFRTERFAGPESV